MTGHTPLNPGFEEVPQAEHNAIYRDLGLVEPITAGEAVRISSFMRAKFPSAPSHVGLYTLAPALSPRGLTTQRWLGLLTEVTVAPDQMPEKISRCQVKGEDVMAMVMYCSRFSYLEVLKGQDDWWWAMFNKGTRYYYKCDQLPGLLALISRIASQKKLWIK
jgi:hypothetical protein